MLQGSCLCGKVRYQIQGSPEAMYYCHCGACRKASGSSFATNMVVREADFLVTAGVALIKSYQSSAGEQRHFCAGCGSPIYAKAQGRPDRISLRCGTLDGDPVVRPREHIYTGSKAPWLEICDGLPQFTGEPEP